MKLIGPTIAVALKHDLATSASPRSCIVKTRHTRLDIDPSITCGRTQKEGLFVGGPFRLRMSLARVGEWRRI